jgi:hypothetical protein
MLTESDIDFMKQSFYYAMLRMEDLDISNWGSYEIKRRRIQDTKQRQKEILNKLKKLVGEQHS